jgi:uncharacterized YccA/Bax inhibitor family protein
MAFGESKNPMVRERTWQLAQEDAGTGTMSITGAINKTGILLAILIASSVFAWQQESAGLGMAGGLLGFVAAIFLSFNPAQAPWVAPVYAVLEGLLVGTISVFAEARYPGIPGNAVAMTFGTLAIMLACYRTGLLRATPMFKRVVIFATLAIALTYIVDLVLMMFGLSIPALQSSSPLGIGISVVITGVAALNLILDFDLFERNSHRSPKYMEWYCGFSMLVTLVWLYLEMVRLLSKLNRK